MNNQLGNYPARVFLTFGVIYVIFPTSSSLCVSVPWKHMYTSCLIFIACGRGWVCRGFHEVNPPVSASWSLHFEELISVGPGESGLSLTPSHILDSKTSFCTGSVDVIFTRKSPPRYGRRRLLRRFHWLWGGSQEAPRLQLSSLPTLTTCQNQTIEEILLILRLLTHRIRLKLSSYLFSLLEIAKSLVSLGH